MSPTPFRCSWRFSPSSTPSATSRFSRRSPGVHRHGKTQGGRQGYHRGGGNPSRVRPGRQIHFHAVQHHHPGVPHRRRHPAVPGGAEHALRRHAGYQDHARREGRGAGAGDGRRHPRGHPDAGPGAISIVMLYMSRGDLFEGGIVFAAIAATMAMSCSAMPMSSSGEWEQRTRWPSPGSWVSSWRRLRCSLSSTASMTLWWNGPGSSMQCFR